eukprot:1246499-Amphidinium_carterae.1
MEIEYVIRICSKKLGLVDDGSRMQIWHGADRVPQDSEVQEWPGLQPRGEISEYQLIVVSR